MVDRMLEGGQAGMQEAKGEGENPAERYTCWEKLAVGGVCVQCHMSAPCQAMAAW